MALDHQTIEELARSPAGRFSAERNHNYGGEGLSGHVLRYDPGPLRLKFVALAITDSVAGADEVAKQIALELNSVGELAREVLRLRSEAQKGEPVAWRWRNKPDGVWKYQEDVQRIPDTETQPLFLHPAPSSELLDLEWHKVGQLAGRATPPTGTTYAIEEFRAWDQPFQLVIREADDAKTLVSCHHTLDAAKQAAKADFKARIQNCFTKHKGPQS